MAGSSPYGLVVESSDSGSYLGAVLEGQLCRRSFRRVEVGGRLLNAHLREVMAFRHVNLKHYELLVRQIKHACCFVSLDFGRDMARPPGYFSRAYALPDLDVNQPGQLIPAGEEPPPFREVLKLDKERFQVPELLFTPRDIMLDQQGIVECLEQVLAQHPPALHHALLSNVVLAGGNCRIPLMVERFSRELRKVVP
jgi:actin-related protein 6